MKKRLATLALACVLTVGSSLPVFAAANETASAPETAQIQLQEGETIVGDTIIGVPVASDVNAPRLARSDCPNYAKSTEILLVRYDGYIQFKASYLTQSGDGSGLVAGRHVKQGWIDYRRKGSSVIGGNVYTETAASKADTKIYSAEASCWDDLFDWSDDATTVFYRGWFYFV